MEELIEQFKVQTADGRVLDVFDYGLVIRRLPDRTLYGQRTWRLADGRHLNPVNGDPEAFQIFDTDEIVRKIG